MYDKFFLKLLGVSSAHAEMSRKAFEELGLTEGQPKILFILRRQNGYVQKELAESCSVRQSTLTVQLAKLEEQGFIYRETCHVSGRKRAFRIYLTEAGHVIAERLEEVVDEIEKKCFMGFSEAEEKQLKELLQRVERNIRNGQ